jgi:hypothetical protein
MQMRLDISIQIISHRTKNDTIKNEPLLDRKPHKHIVQQKGIELMDSKKGFHANPKRRIDLGERSLFKEENLAKSKIKLREKDKGKHIFKVK